MFVGYGIHVFIYVHISIYSMIKSYAIAKYMMFFFKSCAHMHINYIQREKGGGMMPVESFFVLTCRELATKLIEIDAVR